MGKITTRRLVLRPLLVDDITPAYIDSLNDPEVVRYTEARHVTWTDQKVREYVRDSNFPGVSELIGIFLNHSGRHIGNIRLSNFSNIHRRVDLGIMIFDKTQWSKGYATDALVGVSRYVFGELRYHKICADYHAVHHSSARTFAKAGYRVEGIFKDHFVIDGEFVDSVRIALVNGKKSSETEKGYLRRSP